MRYFFDRPGLLRGKAKGRFLLLCLDFDGTLSRIAATPRQAVLDPGVKDVLRKLAGVPRCRVAVISGRALADVKKKVGIADLIYAGNHGLEVEGPGIKLQSLLVPRLRAVLERVRDDLKKKFKGIPGVLLEDKGSTLSVHYRLARKKDLPRIKKIFHEVTRFFLVRKKLKVSSGKKVFEVRPPLEWDKGKVILWLLSAQKALLKNRGLYPVYLGDDATDEDAFRVLRKKGLGIFVGRPRRSLAPFYLKNPRDVKKFLENILVLRGRKDG